MSKFKDELEREKEFANQELEANEPNGEADEAQVESHPDFEEEHQGRSWQEENDAVNDLINNLHHD